MVQPPEEPSPETVRNYLAATAQRELDSLRAELDARLSALEAALARPDPRTSLEDLVLQLARVATAEAESATARACLEAQLHAQQRAAATASELQRALEAERAITHALRRELEQARPAVEVERDAAARLRTELGDIRKSLDAQRSADAEHRGQIEELTRALQNERERSRALDSDLVGLGDRLASLSEAHAALQGELAAAQRAIQTGAADDDAHRAAVDTLERRCAKLEHEASEAAARASEAIRERDALMAALNAERQGARVFREEIQARTAAVDVERANAERSWKAAEARAAEASAERDTLAARLEGAEKVSEGVQAAVRARLAAIEAERARTVKVWEEAEARASAVTRERDELAAELEAFGKTTPPDAEIARRLKAATERILDLENRLFERGPSDQDVDLGALLDTTVPPPSAHAGQRARRYAFPPATKVRIGRAEWLLVDLSVTGAQLIGATSPDVGQIVTLALLSDETPCFCQARVLWARREQTSKRGPFKYRAGVVFTAADEAAIEAFIKRHAIS